MKKAELLINWIIQQAFKQRNVRLTLNFVVPDLEEELVLDNDKIF